MILMVYFRMMTADSFRYLTMCTLVAYLGDDAGSVCPVNFPCKVFGSTILVGDIVIKANKSVSIN